MKYTANYKYQPETMEEYSKLGEKTVDESSHALGLKNGEPLIVAMDGLLRYAKAYRTRFESDLAADGVLGVIGWRQSKGCTVF